MATASDYLKYNNPINAPSDPSRGFSDQIYIDFTQGKKSLDEQLKEVDLANKQLALEQQKMMPTDAALQEFGWSQAQASRAADQSVFDRQIAQSEEARRAQSAVYEGEQNKRQNQAARQDKKKFRFDRKMSTQEMALKQESSAREAQAAQQQLAIQAQEDRRAAALAPYQLQAAQAAAAQESQKAAGTYNPSGASGSSSSGSSKNTIGLNYPSSSVQYYTPSANAGANTGLQYQYATSSINNPTYKPPGVLTPVGQGSGVGRGTWQDPQTGAWYYI